MFTVLNQKSGKSFQTGEDVAVLDGALSHGLNFPYGCQNGFCGKCKAIILKGEIGYKDEVPEALTDEDLRLIRRYFANVEPKAIYISRLMK